MVKVYRERQSRSDIQTSVGTCIAPMGNQRDEDMCSPSVIASLSAPCLVPLIGHLIGAVVKPSQHLPHQPAGRNSEFKPAFWHLKYGAEHNAGASSTFLIMRILRWHRCGHRNAQARPMRALPSPS